MLVVMAYLLSLVVLAATVFAVVDIILRDDSQIKHLPKALWLILVILVPLLGVILWFVLGREHTEGAEPVVRMPRRPRASRPPRPVPQPPMPPRDMRTTEQQLADLEREIEEERLRAELRRRQQEGGRADQSAE